MDILAELLAVLACLFLFFALSLAALLYRFKDW